MRTVASPIWSGGRRATVHAVHGEDEVEWGWRLVRRRSPRPRQRRRSKSSTAKWTSCGAWSHHIVTGSRFRVSYISSILHRQYRVLDDWMVFGASLSSVRMWRTARRTDVSVPASNIYINVECDGAARLYGVWNCAHITLHDRCGPVRPLRSFSVRMCVCVCVFVCA